MLNKNVLEIGIEKGLEIEWMYTWYEFGAKWIESYPEPDLIKIYSYIINFKLC